MIFRSFAKGHVCLKFKTHWEYTRQTWIFLKMEKPLIEYFQFLGFSFAISRPLKVVKRMFLKVSKFVSIFKTYNNFISNHRPNFTRNYFVSNYFKVEKCYRFSTWTFFLLPLPLSFLFKTHFPINFYFTVFYFR